MYVVLLEYSMFTKEKEIEKFKETTYIQFQWLPLIITKGRIDSI